MDGIPKSITQGVATMHLPDERCFLSRPDALWILKQQAKMLKTEDCLVKNYFESTTEKEFYINNNQRLAELCVKQFLWSFEEGEVSVKVLRTICELIELGYVDGRFLLTCCEKIHC